MKELLSAWDAFNNPDSPWYYVVAIIFLVLIFGALTVYMVYAGKHKKPDDSAEQTGSIDNAEKTEDSRESTDEATTEKPAEETASEEKTVTADEPVAEEADSETIEPAPTEEPAMTDAAQKVPSDDESVEQKSEGQKSEETAESEKATAAKPTAKKSQAKSTSAKSTKSTAKSAQKKAFIDRLIDDRSAHLIYNEIKNTILSYPGFKAKLNKDGEGFFFGEEKKAGVTLDGGKIELYLYVDPTTVPEQFDVENIGGELPTKLTVGEDKLDDAQKLIFFAMNVAMLTRNSSRRYVDYVQNAINAKARANKK